MLQFENEKILYALLLIPIMIVIYVYLYYRYKKRIYAYGEKHLITRLTSDVSMFMQHLKFSLLCLIWCCLVFALANPQRGMGLAKEKRKGIEIMFCLDVSNSMLAQDYVPNRIEAAKRSVMSFIDKLQGDKIGIVIFAGKSFVQLPITSDYAAAKMFVNNISTTQINTQGTDIAGAIDVAAASMLPQAGLLSNNAALAKQKKTNKAIIVVSDGEDHFDEAVEVAEQVAKQGIHVYTLGVGSTQGEPIPIRTKSGVDYKKDKDGNTVITRLNEQVLKDIAQAGNGAYIYANNAYMGFEELKNQLDKLEKTEMEEVSFSIYESKYYIPLWIAFFLTIVELFLFSRKLFDIKIMQRIKRNNILPCYLLIVILSIANIAFGQTKEELQAVRAGNRQYKQAEKLNQEAEKLQSQQRQSNQNEIAEKNRQAQALYNNANTNYIKANTSTGNYYKSLFNQGDALYRQGKYEDAQKKWASVLENTQIDKTTKAKTYHNLGNSLLQQQKYQESIEAYKQALKLEPKDMDTKYNLEYAKKMLLMQQQNQQNNQQNNQNNKDNKENQDKKDQNQNNQDKNQDNNQDNNQDKNKDNNNQDKQDKNKDNKKDNQQESPADRQKREQMKRQLDALQQNEKNTQEKVQLKETQTGRPVKQEKDW